MAAIVLGHAGHWVASLIYVVPVAVVVVAICIQAARDRRQGIRGDEDEASESARQPES